MIDSHQQAESDLQNGFRLYRVLNKGRWWRAGFSVAGERYFRYFSDAEYGSPEAARNAAEQFALENSELHEELLPLRRRFEVRTTSRSGIPGVSRYEGDTKHGPFWLAYWDDRNGRRVTRRFSINRLGGAKARELAVKAREAGVRPFRERYEQVLQSLGLDPEAP